MARWYLNVGLERSIIAHDAALSFSTRSWMLRSGKARAGLAITAGANLAPPRNRRQLRSVNRRFIGGNHLGTLALQLVPPASAAAFLPAAGGCLAYFIATFVFYWWHR